MMADTDDARIFGLMELAETHQRAVETAADTMAAEREALRGEREALADAVSALAPMTRAAVRDATRESLAEAKEEAERAAMMLHRIVQWASWQLLLRLLALAALVMLLGWLGSNAVLLWDAKAIASMQMTKAHLQADISTMRANNAEWAAAGMLAKIDHCGSNNRPCVRVNESAGAFGDKSDYRILQGY